MREQTDLRKAKPIVIVTASLVALIALVLLFAFIAGSGLDVGSSTVVQAVTPTDGSNSNANYDEPSAGIEDERKADSGNGVLPELDWEGVVFASGEFDLNSVPDRVAIPLDSSDEYVAILNLLKSLDSEFNPNGYLVQAHNGIDRNIAGGSGNVWATLYAGDVETSSCYIIAISDGTIKYVSVRSIFHPTQEKLDQIAKLKSDFETSSAGKREIERVKASLWPNAEGSEQYEYSEKYYFDFASDRLYLYVNDNRWVGEYETRHREPRYGSIDVQQVLGRWWGLGL